MRRTTKSIGSVFRKRPDPIKRIVLLSGNQLALNPRVWKELVFLKALGYQVEALVSDGCSLLSSENATSPGKKFGLPFVTGKVLQKVGCLVHRLCGWETSWQLGPMANALWSEARRKSADLYIAHSEVGLWAAEKLRQEGRTVGVDMEDWFSEDLLPQARRGRPIRLLKKLERNLLCEGLYSSCTSEAMAEALVKEYGCRRPVVIRNVFPLKDREGLDGKWSDRPGMAKWMESNDLKAERPKEAPVSIHWFSQTIGPGRGLEILFQALEGMDGNWELHLRGNLKGYETWLEHVCPIKVRQKLTLHAMVQNQELPSRIAEHDIGYAGELHDPISRNLTITNKFYQYLQAGLAVVASDTAGQVEAASGVQGAVWVFQGCEKTSLAEKLGGLLRDRRSLQNARQHAWQAGARLTWENESQRMQAALP